jgi:hypothetical protein
VDLNIEMVLQVWEDEIDSGGAIKTTRDIKKIPQKILQAFDREEANQNGANRESARKTDLGP